MARLTPLWTSAETTDTHEIASFLAQHGIAFERWDMPDEVARLAGQDRLTDEDKARLLDLFRGHLDRLASEQGYVDADVVAIRADLPNVDEALAKFDKVHYHDDDEVRAIVGGRGVFGFVADDGRQFLLLVEPGEFISVPAGTWHWFYCTDERNITALRLFRDTTGWVPHYRSTERGGPKPALA